MTQKEIERKQRLNDMRRKLEAEQQKLNEACAEFRKLGEQHKRRRAEQNAQIKKLLKWDLD